MQKKKILHITFDMRIGGTEMVIKSIIEGCDNDRFEMSIFCLEAPLGPWGKDLQKAGISVNTKARKEGFDTSLIQAIRKHIKFHHIDIIHCHQYTPWVYGTLAALGLKTKVIFTEHGRFYPDSSSWKRRFVNPILALFTHKLTAISEATKQALVDYEFLRKDEISVIYNGIEPLVAHQQSTSELSKKLGIAQSDLVFGTIARLDPIKNHAMMLKAFANVTLQKPEAKLIIVGDGDLMDELTALIKTLSLQNNVIMTGYIPYPKDVLAIFNIFLLSSLSEGTSMTLLEAMSLGKPCIVTNAGGNKEIVEHEETGLVVDNDNMQEFADAMLLLANDKVKTQAYAQQAKQRFDDKFDERHMSKAYSVIYGE